MEKEPLVSIVMPLYETEKYLQETIDSVLEQSYENWELIIVDDCSKDNSFSIALQNSADDSRIKAYQQKNNQGAAAARNRAIQVAKGDYLAFLDSDDIWLSNKLEKQISFMIENNLSFTCSYYGKINENSKTLRTVKKSPSQLNYNKLLLNCPGNSTVIYSVKALGKTQIPNIKKRNDYLMWLRVIKKAGKIHTLPETLAYHRIRTGSISQKKLTLVKYHWYIYTKLEHIGYLKSIVILSILILRGIKVKLIK